MKTLKRAIVLAAFAFAVLLPCQAVKAQDFEKLEVTTGNTIQEVDDNVKITTTTMTVNDKVPETRFYSFTIDKESVVKISIKADQTMNSLGSLYTYLDGSCSLYSDKMMNKELWKDTHTYLDALNTVKIIKLNKGTYYLKMDVKNHDKGIRDTNVQMFAQAIPVDKAYSLNYKVVNNKVLVSANNNIMDWLPYNYLGFMYTNNVYFGPSYTYKIGDTKTCAKVDFDENSTIYKEIYFCMASDKDSAGSASGSKVAIEVKPDIKAPTVKGVKNNKTYTKPVKISYSDASGIQKATLNGKAIKNKTTVKKAGKYTLIVTDKKGNTTKIKFTIKK